MVAKKEAAKVLERTYIVPLRKEYMKVPRWKKSKKAVTALRQFLVKHMKSEEVKIGKEVNEYVWNHGIKNPPHHVKVTVTKDDKGVVKAELFGNRKVSKKEVKKVAEPKKEEVKAEEKPVVKEEIKEVPKVEVKEEATPVKEEKKEEVKEAPQKE
jgi:large subunit ribosomal protein L31e